MGKKKAKKLRGQKADNLREHPLVLLASATMAAALQHGLCEADGKCETVCEEVTVVGADGVARTEIVCRVVCEA